MNPRGMAEGPRNLPSKKDVVLALLQGPSVFVHLDPRKKGVVVPSNFRKQPQLVLQIGLNMAVQIPDLRVDDDGISCTLSFSRSPFWCCLPWFAVYAIVSEDGPGMVWPEDVPPEVAAQMQAAVTKQQPKRPRPKLAAVGPAPEDSEPEENAPEAAGAESRSSSAAAAPAVQRSGASAPQGGRQGGGAEVVPIRPNIRREPDPPEEDELEEAEDTPRPPGGQPRGTPGGPPGLRAVPGKKGRRELPPYLRVIK